MTFTQNFTSMLYNVTAVEQADPSSGVGPAYLLNGLSNTGYWYQVGLSWNWCGPVSGACLGYVAGFNMVYEVFDSNGSATFPTDGGAGLANYSGAVNTGDPVALSLSFSNGNVTMLSEDLNTGAEASASYSAEGATSFLGLPSSTANLNGYFTGLMTEWYHPNAYYGSEQKVTYSSSFALSSAWMWMDEFGCSEAGCTVFAYSTSSPVSYAIPTLLQASSFFGATESSDAYEFVTGFIPILAVSCDHASVVVGAMITCRATAVGSGSGSGSAPTGSVAWSSNSTGTFSSPSCRLSKGACSVKFTPGASGSSVVLTASYGGDTKNAPSTGTYSLEVTVKVSKTAVSCTSKSAVAGSLTIITCAAKVSGYSPTGTVSWTQGGTGSVSFSAPTTCTPFTGACSVTMTGSTAGSLNITASYAGDANNAASYAVAKLTVTKAKTTLSITCTQTSLVDGTTTSCTASVSGPYSPHTGSVTLSESGSGEVTLPSETCPLSAGSCSVNVTASAIGKVSIQAVYAGDSNNQGSSRAGKMTITKAPTAITVSCTQSTFGVGTPVTCTATVSGGYPSQTGTVTWSKVSGKVTFSSTTCALSSGSCSVMVTATAAGSVEIKAAYGGDSDNVKSSGTLVLSIT